MQIDYTLDCLKPYKDRLDELYSGVLSSYLNNVIGDIAEFGTAAGLSAQILATALTKSEGLIGDHILTSGLQKKKLHLFDSFAGLPKVDSGPDTTSPHVVCGAWGPGVFKGISETELLDLVSRFLEPSRVSTFSGWYKDTVPTIPRGTKYSLVHIDCDLYSSTIDVLDSLFSIEAISEGCKIFFDDYDYNRASPRHGERRAWKECISKYSIDYSDYGSYGHSSHKFIVHSYSVPSQRLD